MREPAIIERRKYRRFITNSCALFSSVCRRGEDTAPTVRDLVLETTIHQRLRRGLPSFNKEGRFARRNTAPSVQRLRTQTAIRTGFPFLCHACPLAAQPAAIHRQNVTVNIVGGR